MAHKRTAFEVKEVALGYKCHTVEYVCKRRGCRFTADTLLKMLGHQATEHPKPKPVLKPRKQRLDKVSDATSLAVTLLKGVSRLLV